MTNRPYESDMPSLTRLKAMEDEAMGFTSSETSKVVQQHPAINEGTQQVAEEDSSERPCRHQRFAEDLDDQCRNASPHPRETATMDVDVMTEDHASHSPEMICQCEGHWLFDNAVLEGHVDSKAKERSLGSPTCPGISTSPDTGPRQSQAEVDDLYMHKSDPAQLNSTADEHGHLIAKDDLLIMLQVGFAERSYWTTADLEDALQQPEAYLNEVLPEIAIFGPWLGGYPQRWCWRLKPAEVKSEVRWKGKGRMVEDEGSW